MIKLIAFDWNGTIVNDVQEVLLANNVVLEHYGYAPISLSKYQETFTIPIRDYWKALGFDVDHFDKIAEEQEKLFLANFEPWEEKVQLREGVTDLLKYIDEQQVRRIVFSNHIVPHIEKQIKRLNLDQYFEKVLARPLYGREHQHKRFKEDFLYNFIEENKLAPSEVMVVGDTTEEIDIGKKFGYTTVAITEGHHSTERLKKSNPDYLVFSDLSQIIEIIQNINGRTA